MNGDDMPHFEFSSVRLPIQIHASAELWGGRFLKRSSEGMTGNRFKPMNGFWTSSERKDGNSAWLDLCCDQGRLEKISAIEVHRFEVIGTPRVWVLKNDEQLIDAASRLKLLPEWIDSPDWHDYINVPSHDADEELSGRYHLNKWINDQMEVLLDCGDFWGKFYSFADAVHTPADAKFSDPWMNSFEVESTCWFSPEQHLRHLGVRRWP
ncbi:MAG: hypothetical protein INF88_19620 [Roseomonas sp.]|nr:hypothetical protein [Roseomonas sp.]